MAYFILDTAWREEYNISSFSSVQSQKQLIYKRKVIIFKQCITVNTLSINPKEIVYIIRVILLLLNIHLQGWQL